MVRAEPKPGRRRATPPSRRSERTAPVPQRPRPPVTTPTAIRLARVVWFVAFLAALTAVVLPWTAYDTPPVLPLAGAVGLTTVYTLALAVRAGGRPWISGGLALALCTAAAVSGSEVMLAGAAVGTAVVAGVLAVLATAPAARFVGVVREVAIATVVAAAGAFAVRAYDAQLSLERTGYLAIGLSLLGALTLVYRLGAGLHGLGRRGSVMIVGGVGLLTLTLAYTEALAHWGSPGLIESVDRVLMSVRDLVGAVPRPIEVLLGFPALAWGVSTRARRRQGWWVCAFGAPGLAVVAVSLLDPGTTLGGAGLTVLYSVLLGLAVGYAVIRADLFLTGARGRRARRLEEMAAHRPEAQRLEPLL